MHHIINNKKVFLIFMLILTVISLSLPFFDKENENIFIVSTTLDGNVNYSISSNRNSRKNIYSQKRSNYPSGAYDEKNNILYFSESDGKKTKLVSYNIKSGKKYILFDSFRVIDSLKYNKTDKCLYMRVVLDGKENVHLAIYDIKSSSLKVWNEADDDDSLESYSIVQNRLSMITFSIKDRTDKTISSNEKQTKLKPPTFTIFVYDSVTKELLFNKRLENKFIKSITTSKDGKKLLLLQEERDEDISFSFLEFNFKTKKYSTIVKLTNEFLSIWNIGYSQNDSAILFIGALIDGEDLIANDGQVGKKRGLYTLDILQRNIRTYNKYEKNIINDFQKLD